MKGKRGLGRLEDGRSWKLKSHKIVFTNWRNTGRWVDVEDQCFLLVIKLLCSSNFLYVNASLSIVKQIKRSQGFHFKQISDEHSPEGNTGSKYEVFQDTDLRNSLLLVGGKRFSHISEVCGRWVLVPDH